MSTRRRSNKTQQEMLVEHLHANLMLARGNIASPEVAAFWAALTLTLNRNGCRRTVAEWQSIWSQWVQKVKSKYRKHKEQTQGTGGGPAVVRSLTETELKVLEVVGTAAVDGFANLETPLVASVENRPPPLTIEVELLPSTEVLQLPPTVELLPPPPAVQPPVVEPSATVPPLPSPDQLPSTSTGQRAHSHPYLPPSRRRQRTRPPRPKPAELLTGSLDRNNELFRHTITQAAETLAAAIREAGEAISLAITNYGGGGQMIEEYLEPNLD